VKPITTQLVPITGKAAIKWIAEVHRHLPKLQGALFAVGVEDNGKLVGVGTAGNPPRVWQGTGRFVITRVAVLASPRESAIGMEPWHVDMSTYRGHAGCYCSMIYGALCRAGKALGYREAWTYTLHWEPGTSLRAAGFIDMGMTNGGEWDRPSRPRKSAAQPEPKRRWMRQLVATQQQLARAA
jgi:hypothetical protein